MLRFLEWAGRTCTGDGQSKSKWAVSHVTPYDQDEDEYDNEQHSADDPPHPSHGIAALAAQLVRAAFTAADIDGLQVLRTTQGATPLAAGRGRSCAGIAARTSRLGWRYRRGVCDGVAAPGTGRSLRRHLSVAFRAVDQCHLSCPILGFIEAQNTEAAESSRCRDSPTIRETWPWQQTLSADDIRASRSCRLPVLRFDGRPAACP